MPMQSGALGAALFCRRANPMTIVYRGLAVAALVISLSACASSPDNIKAANISPAQFSYMTCPQLADYKVTLTAAYSKAADEQDTARTEDAVGLVLLGASVGTASHQWTAWQVSDLKGRIAAIDELQAKGNCTQTQE